MLKPCVWTLMLLVFAGCDCGEDRLRAVSDPPPPPPPHADAGSPPVPDAGTPPPPPDAGHPPRDEPGCSDGTREGFVSLSQYPAIAACAGGWSVPGLTAAGMGQSPVMPACGRASGNTGSNREGSGCSAADLCAAGWHVCRGEEVQAKAPSGCADAVPSGTPDLNNSNYVLYAVAQHSFNNSVCDLGPMHDNDVFGCGRFGQTLGSASACGVLNQVLASAQAGSCGWAQAVSPNGPWRCQGSNSWNEGDFVTKDGCPNGSCSEGGFNFGNSDKGGVLCCHD